MELLGRGFAWLDTGTHETLLQASAFVQTIQYNQATQVACLEEIAYANGWIDKGKILNIAKSLSKNEYGRYLKNLVGEK